MSAPTITKIAEGSGATNWSSQVITTNVDAPAGSTIVVMFAWYDTPTVSTLSSITDSTGTYTLDVARAAAGTNPEISLTIASLAHTATFASGSTITVTMSGSTGASGQPRAWSVVSINAASIPLDPGKTSTNTGTTSQSLSVGSLSSTQALSVYLGGYFDLAATSQSALPTGNATEVTDLYVSTTNSGHLWTAYIVESAILSDAITGSLAVAPTLWTGAQAVYTTTPTLAVLDVN